ncbi:hypothetical protein B0O80DRAFT_235965 [Mortierella sp. GBAus27b]|nr:hypothetical protein B0O80DRAFT_235965 [Mortierella sp. GBAus27b]
MYLIKTVIVAVTAAAVVSASPLRLSPFHNKMWHDIGESCDRPVGQCRGDLMCDLHRFKCVSLSQSVFQHNMMCSGLGETCYIHEECCAGACIRGTCM